MNRIRVLLGNLTQETPASPDTTPSTPTKLFLELNKALLQKSSSAIQEAMTSWEKRKITPQDLQQIQKELSLEGSPSSQLFKEVSSLLLSSHFLRDPTSYRKEKHHVQLLLFMKVFKTFLDVCISPKEKALQWEKFILSSRQEETLLHSLARQGDFEGLQMILSMLTTEQKKRFLGMKNVENETPLHLACKRNDPEIIGLLIENGAPLFDLDSNLNTILHMVVRGKKEEALSKILEVIPASDKKELLSAKSLFGDTPFLLACYDCNIKIIDILMEHEVDLLAENSLRNNILHILAKKGNAQILHKIWEKLTPEQRNQLIHRKNSQEETPLLFASKEGNREAIQFLIEKGADLSTIDRSQNNIVHMLVMQNNPETFAKLLALFSDKDKEQWIHGKNSQGQTPLLLACKQGNPKIVQLLIQNGASLFDVDQFGNNLLHILAMPDYSKTLTRLDTSDTLRMVLAECPPEKKNEWISAKNASGDTPLCLACQAGSPTIQILIQNGATLFDVDRFHNTALHLLVLYNNSLNLNIIVTTLTPKEKNELFHTRNVNGKTPFHMLDIPPKKFLSEIHATLLKRMLVILLPEDPHSRTLRTIEKLLAQNKMNFLCDFGEFIQNKLPLYSDSASIDAQVSSLLETFAELHPLCSDMLLYSLRMNAKLALDSQNLQKVVTLYKKFENTSYADAILIAIQTCEDINLFTSAVEALSSPPIYNKDQFLALSIESQAAMMSRFVVFRDRKGLALASNILKRASQNPKLVSPKLITLALQLIEKIQILPNPSADEDALIDLIWALLPYQKDHPERAHILSKGLFSFARVDAIRLNKQYRAGIFHIFTFAKELQSEEILLSSIRSLGVYSYDPSKEEDREIIQSLIDLAKEKDLSLSMQRELALVLSTICEEAALLTAWKLVQGPAWDRYQEWAGSHEKLHTGNLDLFTFYPSVIHENRGNMRKKILDLLGEYHKKEYKPQVDHIYERFQKAPSSYPRLHQLQEKLLNLPDKGIRFLDPLFLPPNSSIFRGIGARKGGTRVHDALLDLFMRGIGDSELTRAQGQAGIWAKAGQLYFALDIGYVKDYADSEGAFLVVDGDYINEAILHRKARLQVESSMHYVLYDTVSHEHIKAIYVAKDLKEEILFLRSSDINNPPTQLKYFSYLDRQELVHFIQALQHDPYQICNKLKEADLTLQFNPDEPETPFEKLVEENVKREIVRGLMEEKYTSDFGGPKGKVRSKL